jgi:hypothetical protein
MNYAELIIFAVAILVHCGILVWAVVDLWSLRAPTFPDVGDAEEAGGRLWSLPLVFIFLQALTLFCIVGSAIGMCFWLSLFYDVVRRGGAWDNDRKLAAFTYLFFSAGWGFPVIAIPILFVYLDFTFFSLSSLFDIPLFVLTFVGPVLLFRAIRWLCSRYPILSINVLLVPEEIRGARPPSGAVWAFSLFILTLLVCTLWYCFRFDPTGTVNPGWTGIFG